MSGNYHPNRSFNSLNSGDSVVIPQDGGHSNRSGQVLDFVPIDGEDDLLLSEDSSFLSLPPQSSLGGPGDGGRVVVPLYGGHGDSSGLVPDSATSGGKDDPLLSGDSFVSIAPTPVVLSSVLATMTVVVLRHGDCPGPILD